MIFPFWGRNNMEKTVIYYQLFGGEMVCGVIPGMFFISNGIVEIRMMHEVKCFCRIRRDETGTYMRPQG
jgi:hypothetical protein